MSLFTPGPPVLAGVDEVFRVLTTEALKGLVTPVAVTVGPLDRPTDGPRLNWFLYRVAPATAYTNMEPPQHGWRTRRGHPPLALSLHYLLTADAGELSEDGAEDQVVHAALSATMSALHENGIFGVDTPVATGPNRTVADVASALVGMVEPLRIALENLPLETVTALWHTGSHSLRLSVGYQVSLVSVPAQVPATAGPPVLARRVGVAPALIPVIEHVSPTTWFGQPLAVTVRGLTDSHEVTLSRLSGDPDDPTDGRPNPATTPSTGPWKLTDIPAPTGITANLPNAELVPGQRTLQVTNLADGLAAGSARANVGVVPIILTAGAPLQPGSQATLTVRHIAGPGLVFLGATAVPYTVVNASTVTVTVPPLPPDTRGATIPASLRCATITGPPTDLAVAP